MTTTTAVALRGDMVNEIAALAARIETATAEEASGAYDRLKVAREWAKLQENAAALASELVWLEAVILRRIGQLDVRVLASARRAAARHFATLDDAQLSHLLEMYPTRSAVSAYNLWVRAQGLRKWSMAGRAVVTREPTDLVEEDMKEPRALREAIAERVVTVREAAAILVAEYAANMPVTVSHVVSEFIDQYQPVPDDATALEATAFRQGLTTAVREAFAIAPVEGVHGGLVPAFVTTYRDETGEWLRIPSEFATVADAKQMLALKRGQIESMTRAVEHLSGWLETLYRISCRDDGEFMRDDPAAAAARANKRADAS